ncbi:MAG: ABC transporter permease [bacterium]|nr:ABC transporter permease [bacterium]
MMTSQPRTITIAKKEFIHIWRDPFSLFIVIMLPVIMLFLYGYGISYDVKNIVTAVYDLDKSQASRELLTSLEKSGYFRLKYNLIHPTEINDLLDRGKVNLVLWFPPDFEKKLKSDKPAILYAICDGSDSNTAIITLSYLNAIVQTYSNRLMLKRIPTQARSIIAGLPPIEDRLRVWYNPELRSINFLVPGLIAIIMTMSSALLTALSVVRERERGTIEQLMVSPLKPRELIIGKLLPYIVIAFFDVLLTLVLARFWFEVPIYGSITLLLILSMVFLITSLAVGLLISATASNQAAAMLTALLLTMLPTFLLSGFAFPIETMPKFIQPITYLVPARYYLVIVRGIFLKGIGLSVLWKETIILILFAFVLLSIAAKRFKKKLD